MRWSPLLSLALLLPLAGCLDAPADGQACYTGASLGDYSLHVYAVRA